MNSRNMGKTILRLRKEKNMTQKELADKLQITHNAVSKWERGLSYPDISVLLLEVSVDELLTGDAKADKWQNFKELNAADVKEMAGLLCRCVSLALSIGGLAIYLIGRLDLSDFCVLLCTAIILLGIDSMGR